MKNISVCASHELPPRTRAGVALSASASRGCDGEFVSCSAALCLALVSGLHFCFQASHVIALLLWSTFSDELRRAARAGTDCAEPQRRATVDEEMIGSMLFSVRASLYFILSHFMFL